MSALQPPMVSAFRLLTARSSPDRTEFRQSFCRRRFTPSSRMKSTVRCRFSHSALEYSDRRAGVCATLLASCNAELEVRSGVRANLAGQLDCRITLVRRQSWCGACTKKDSAQAQIVESVLQQLANLNWSFKFVGACWLFTRSWSCCCCSVRSFEPRAVALRSHLHDLRTHGLRRAYSTYVLLGCQLGRHAHSCFASSAAAPVWLRRLVPRVGVGNIGLASRLPIQLCQDNQTRSNEKC
jgi:hypothetical protein